MSRAMRAFSRSLPMLLLRSHQAVMAQFRPVLRANGITEQQWRVLRALSSVDEARISRLAELTLISKPSLSRLLPALEARRLVRRSATEDDGRGASIRIAPAGTALIGKVAPHSEARYRAIGAAIGDDAMAQLYDLLPRLAERLEASAGPLASASLPTAAAAPAPRRPATPRSTSAEAAAPKRRVAGRA
ncbi:MAG: homoprotocatechuate degradation operon regulator HpaR [Burkholderiales bacterium]|nr:MAG: homoprotocatechuate degradation operon regulator HpaR [Burkholderiales bacterium]